MPYVFIDTETGGLDPKVHGLTEIGIVVFDWQKATGEVDILLGSSIPVLPNDSMAYTPNALKLQGQTLDSLYARAGVKEEMAWELLVEKLHPYIPGWANSCKVMAHYAQFDYGFIAALAQRVNPNTSMGQGDHRCHWSCTKHLWTWMRNLGIHDCPKSHLKDIANYYDIKQTAAHTALDDALTGVECFRHMMIDIIKYPEGERKCSSLLST